MKNNEIGYLCVGREREKESKKDRGEDTGERRNNVPLAGIDTHTERERLERENKEGTLCRTGQMEHGLVRTKWT